MFDINNILPTNTNFNNIYLGVIEDNNDPQKMGRCKIRILGIHTSKKTKTNSEGIPTSELPWALPATSISGGSNSGNGEFGVPVQGSWVSLFFINGDHNNPVYFASIGGNPKTAPDSSKGFNDPDGVYPNILNEPDWNKYARGETLNSEKNSSLETYEPTSDAAPEYPNNTVIETPKNGIVVEYDSTPNKERWHVYHKASGSYLEIKPNGDTIFKSAKDKYEITAGAKKIYIKTTKTEKVENAVTEDYQSNQTTTVGGNQINNIDGNQTDTIGGNLVINISGTTTINSSGICKINGGNVEIDGGSGGVQGVVTGPCICAFTGGPHLQMSGDVKSSLG